MFLYWECTQAYSSCQADGPLGWSRTMVQQSVLHSPPPTIVVVQVGNSSKHSFAQHRDSDTVRSLLG
jgi:hypothetical protein